MNPRQTVAKGDDDASVALTTVGPREVSTPYSPTSEPLGVDTSAGRIDAAIGELSGALSSFADPEARGPPRPGQCGDRRRFAASFHLGWAIRVLEGLRTCRDFHSDSRGMPPDGRHPSDRCGGADGPRYHDDHESDPKSAT